MKRKHKTLSSALIRGSVFLFHNLATNLTRQTLDYYLYDSSVWQVSLRHASNSQVFV